MKDSRYHPYEEKFILFSDFVERIIKKTLIIFVVLLVFAQFLLLFDDLRNLLVPLEYFEGSIANLRFFN